MATITINEKQRGALADLLDGPLTRMNLGVESGDMERLQEGGLIKRCGFSKPKRGRPGILYRLTDKGRKRARR